MTSRPTRGARKRLVALATLAAVLAWAQPVFSFIPSGMRIAKATAKANEAGARLQALQLVVSLRVADREPIATGSLVTHPNGLARLELRDGNAMVERHLLVGTEHTASREGAMLAAPRPFLPPLFLLQAGSLRTLVQALADYGMDPAAVALAPCGDRVCYVVGDPSRVAPTPPTDEELEEMREAAADPSHVAEPGPEESREETPGVPPPTGTVWIDVDTYEIVRFESQEGVATELGPFVAFGDVRFPDSLTILEPGREPVHLDFSRVTPVNAPAAGFGLGWLLAPSPEPAPGSDAGPEAAPDTVRGGLGLPPSAAPQP